MYADRFLFASIALLTAAGVVAGLFQEFDSDLFWHLRCGYEMVRSGHLERYDVYSYTAGGTQFINHEWLADIVLAVFHRMGGFDAIVIAKAFFCGCLLLMIMYACAARGGRGMAIPWSALYALILMRFRLYSKPELASFFLILVSELVAVRYLEQGASHLLWALPPLALIWASTHLFVVIGIGILAVHAVGEGLGRRVWPESARGRGRPEILGLTALGCAGITLLNPYGIGLYLPVIQINLSPAIQTSAVREWLPPTFSAFPIFYLLAPAASVVFLITIRRSRLQDILLWATTLALAFKSNRHIGLFAVVSSPILARHLTAGAELLRPHLTRHIPSLSALLGGRVVQCVAFVSTLAWVTLTLLSPHHSLLHQDQSREFRPGTGLLQKAVPVASVEFVESKRLNGPIYNTYHLGGYLIWRSWPRLRVFIDGRHTMYESLFEWLQNHGPEEILAQLSIRLGLVGYQDPGYIAAFRSNQAFRLVFFDDAAMVFLRSDSEDETLASYRLIRPEDLSMDWYAALDQRGREEAAEEAQCAVRECPSSSRAWMLAGGIARRSSDYRQAIAAYQRAVAIDPTQMSFRNELGVACLEAGDLAAALEHIQEACALNPAPASVHYNRGLVLYRMGNAIEALPAFRAAERRAPHPDDVYLFLGLLEEDSSTALIYLRRFLALSDDPNLRRVAEERMMELKSR